MPHHTRSPETEAYRRWYKTARWQKTRARQLADHPLCQMCKTQGRITAATVCDHINPESKKTEEGFFAGPFQSLCDDPRYRCHSRTKQAEERRAREGKLPLRAVGTDGWPI